MAKSFTFREEKKKKRGVSIDYWLLFIDYWYGVFRLAVLAQDLGFFESAGEIDKILKQRQHDVQG